MKKALFTLLAVLMVGLIKMWLGYFFVYESPFSLFVAAVGICAWYGGYSQGILAYVFSALFIFFQFAPTLDQIRLNQGFWIYGLCLFAFECFVITAGSVVLKKTRISNQKRLEELKEVDRSLKKSEALFRKVYESKLIGLLFFDGEGNLLDANDHFLNMVGHTKQEFVSGELKLQDMTPPDFRELSQKNIEKLKDKIKNSPFETEYFKSDGSRVPVLVGSSKVSENMYVSFVLDISEKKIVEQSFFELNEHLEAKVEQRTRELISTTQRLEKAICDSQAVELKLRQSEVFLDSVIENIPNMIFVKDAKDRRYLRLNKAGEGIWDKKQSEILGKSDKEIFHKAQAEFFEKEDLRLLSSGKMTEDIEDVYVTKGGVRYLHTKRIPIFDDQGSLQYILGIAEDVTEKRRNEIQRIELLREQVARSEAEKGVERLRILAEATTALNESLDIDSMLQSFSSLAVRNLADWCFIDMLDESSGSLSRAMDTYRDPLLKNLAGEYQRNLDFLLASQIQQTMNEGNGRIYFPSQDQKELLSSAIIVPLIYCGKAFGTLTFVLTDSKKVFNNFDLSTCEDLGKRCSLAIVNARLFNKANEASRAKSAFLANMSHEIRTPLGAMLGFAELMMDDGGLTQKQHNYISTIVRNGRHLLRIVDEILDLTKVESERIQIEKTKFSLPKLLDDVLNALKMRAQEKGLELTFNFSNNIAVQVISDPTRVKQILVNVIGNAIKFTERGKVTVDVQLQDMELSPQRHLLKISVEDTGVGIPAREVNQLFQPFVQADGSMTRKYGGTGLGLFLSRKLARLLNGDVVLQKSRFSKGSLFIVSIEVENVEAEDLESSTFDLTSFEKSFPVKQISQMDGKILIVDDSEDNQVLVAHYLQNMGLCFEVAENGREAVDRALRENFDVVLMDIQMPEMDGFQAMQLLRQQNYNKPIVALTAHAMKGDRDRCIDAGFDDYLSKPLSKEDLKRSLIEFFSHEVETHT